MSACAQRGGDFTGRRCRVPPIPCTWRARAFSQGQELMILEAMKMEYTVPAPSGGMVDAAHFAEGDLVDEGAVLLTLRPSED